MKYILIIGSTSDLGNAIAVEYLKKGNDLYLAARNKQALDTQVGKLSTDFPNNKIKPVLFDGNDFSSHQQFYDGLEPKPEGVVSVMGYLGEQKVSELSFEETQKVINANYLGNVSILNCVANDFERRRYGFIVGISSVAADRGRKSNYIYGSAKAGFSTYLSGLRNRLYSSNSHVLTVHPGFIATKMTAHLSLPKRLTSTPQKVAKAIIEGQEKKKNLIYTSGIWKYIMLIIRNIPETLFKRLNI